MAKKDWKKIETRVDELTTRVKNSTITPEERIELAEKRESLRRHEAAEELKALKAELEKAKREALLKIVEANGVTTENQLKNIFRYVKVTKPELLPATPKPETGTTEGATPKPEGETTEGATPKPETGTEGDEAKPKPKTGMEGATGAPVCGKCGATAERRHARKNGRDYWICPVYSKSDRGHLFQWID